MAINRYATICLSSDTEIGIFSVYLKVNDNEVLKSTVAICEAALLCHYENNPDINLIKDLQGSVTDALSLIFFCDIKLVHYTGIADE